MSNELIRQFHSRWQAVAAVEVSEQRAASITLRWQQMNSILQLAWGLKIPTTESNQEEEVVWQRWAKLKGVQI
jgi:hypothetical protein